jgi:ribosomal protein S18 acetylase RimI-like enzyme/SAM-dependent methyltransferase
VSNDNPQARLFAHAHQLLKTHETLLRDAERDRKFYDALKKRVVAGAAVLDIGAGTGIWAIAAAKLGASRVVAVDMDELLVGVIRILAKEHGVSDRVEPICASSFDLHLEREFDVVVSETIGYIGYDERLVEVMGDARKRFLRDGGHIIPETISLHAAPGKLKVRTEPVPIGVDFQFNELARLNLNSPRVLKRPRDVELLGRRVCLISTDLRRADRTPSLRDLKAVWELPDGAAPDCVIVWAESRLAPHVKLSTKSKTTSWLPTVYRIAPPAGAHERLEFSLSLTPESNYWTATYIGSGNRESRSYSPEFAATEMIGAARLGGDITSERGHLLVGRELHAPSMIGLRQAAPDDQEFLRRVYYSTRKEEVEAFGWPEAEQEAFLSMQFTTQQKAYAMMFPHAEQSVILCDGVPAGRLLLNRDTNSISVVDIAVLPEFRRRGIASSILVRLQRDGAAIDLQVDKNNATARRLYERRGFQVTGETLEMRWEPSGVETA